MAFFSWQFVLFLTCSLVIYYLVPGRFQWMILLVSSCWYYLAGGNLRTAPFAIQGTEELAEVTSEALGNDKAVLMANHGAIFVWSTIVKAYEVGAILEESAKVAYLAYTLGKPNRISEQIMKALEKTTEENYGQDK